MDKTIKNIKDRLYRRGIRGTSTESVKAVIKTVTTEDRELTPEEKSIVVDVIMQVEYPTPFIEPVDSDCPQCQKNLGAKFLEDALLSESTDSEDDINYIASFKNPVDYSVVSREVVETADILNIDVFTLDIEAMTEELLNQHNEELKQIDFMSDNLNNFIETSYERRRLKIQQLLENNSNKVQQLIEDDNKQINDVFEKVFSSSKSLPMKVLDKIQIEALKIRQTYESRKILYNRILIYAPIVGVSLTLFLYFTTLIGTVSNATKQQPGYNNIIKNESAIEI